ncbi:hypothetical protein [Clostridium sp. BJN0001]|uniref:hypothetical protein n=1 Tax=Clostridium sp. BJN0001 TaxID=2930219 RepID=UPI001FD23523|nr:hypothetical protein [Clostridium sp. BJN0001]
MRKTLVIKMDDLKIDGDVLDVGKKNSGIIYELCKDSTKEISLDYVDEKNKGNLKKSEFDICTLFFQLSKIGTYSERLKILKELKYYIKQNGTLYIWDINKSRGKIFNNKIKIVIPNKKIKDFDLKNLNILIDSSLEETQKIVQKYFVIDEVKMWEDIFFIKCINK